MRTIAILGVDGTGKSSVIREIYEILGSEKCCVQYMGYKDFEDTTITTLQGQNSRTFTEKIRLMLAARREFLNRINRHKYFGGLVIYDRYVHEIYINSRGLRKFLYKILYRYLFPQPDAIVYLHCGVEVSLSRKNDIQDIYKFTGMKRRFDKTFLHNKHVFAINTETLTSRQLAATIIKHFKLG